MKKILLTFLLLLPAFLSNAQGIKAWNDQLDDFIDVFNQVNPALQQLYSDNGISQFGFTYFEPESANVVMEAAIMDNADYDKITDEVMAKAKDIAISHIANASKTNARIGGIINEFEKRNTKIDLLYSTNKNGERMTKKVVITPAEINAAK